MTKTNKLYPIFSGNSIKKINVIVEKISVFLRFLTVKKYEFEDFPPLSYRKRLSVWSERFLKYNYLFKRMKYLRKVKISDLIFLFYLPAGLDMRTSKVITIF